MYSYENGHSYSFSKCATRTNYFDKEDERSTSASGSDQPSSGGEEHFVKQQPPREVFSERFGKQQPPRASAKVRNQKKRTNQGANKLNPAYITLKPEVASWPVDFAPPPGLTTPPGLATPPGLDFRSNALAAPPGLEKSVVSAPPGLEKGTERNSALRNDSFEKPADYVYEPKAFRKELTTIMRDLGPPRNALAGEAVKRVRACRVPESQQASVYVDILTRTVEEVNGVTRRQCVAFISGLAANGAFSHEMCLRGLKEFFDDVYEDLATEVPKLPHIVTRELLASLKQFFTDAELDPMLPAAVKASAASLAARNHVRKIT